MMWRTGLYGVSQACALGESGNPKPYILIPFLQDVDDEAKLRRCQEQTSEGSSKTPLGFRVAGSPSGGESNEKGN